MTVIRVVTLLTGPLCFPTLAGKRSSDLLLLLCPTPIKSKCGPPTCNITSNAICAADVGTKDPRVPFRWRLMARRGILFLSPSMFFPTSLSFFPRNIGVGCVFFGRHRVSDAAAAHLDRHQVVSSPIDGPRTLSVASSLRMTSRK